MNAAPEIVVDSLYRRTVLTVECIASTGESAEEAVRLRDTLLPEEIEIDDCFFILARISVINLWMPGAARGALPRYTASALPILRAHAHEEIHDMDRGGLRRCMARWLKTFRNWEEEGTSETDRMIIDSGLCERLRGGDVRECGR
jgi:hypothetical protein